MPVKLILSFAIPVVVGFISGASTGSAIREWYPSLRKPWFTPPNWAFGPVWMTLYLMSGWALYQVWSLPASVTGRGLALTAFAVMVILNAAWSPIFFRWRSPRGALPVAYALAASVAVTAWLFQGVHDSAGLWLIPYLAWCCLAALLNLRILQLNPAR